MHLSCTVTKIWGLKDIGVTTLTFWGHVTSSIPWPSDSALALSYWWSMMTMRLSCTDTEIRDFKDFGVTSLTYWGHVTSLDHWNHASILHRYGDIKPQNCIRPCLRPKVHCACSVSRDLWVRGPKWPHIWNFRGHIIYSLYNFYEPTTTIRGRL